MRLSKALRIFPRNLFAGKNAKPRGYIFQIGHMRSFSTLLSHQIGSNPEVAGYFEAHQKYRNTMDLLELEDKIRKAGGHSPAGRFLFDKLLQPLECRDTILQRKDLKVVLMVREPQATIRSILRIHSGGIVDEAAAADYYIRRLKYLQDVLDRRHGRVLYLESEALLDDSATTLSKLGAYLQLSTPLTEAYELFPMTGKSKFGDPSKWIRHGTIAHQRNDDLGEWSADEKFSEVGEAYEGFRRYAKTAAECVILRPQTTPSIS
jgi:hypothetical protein